MANSNKTRLDANQCIVNSFDGLQEAQRLTVTNPEILQAAQNAVSGYDSVNQSQRISIVNSIEYAIELNADDGDSVLTYHDTLVDGSITVTNTPATTVQTTGVACYKYSSCAVFSSIVGSNGNPGYARVQVSPDDTGDGSTNWFTLTGNIIAGNNSDNSISFPSQNTGVSTTYNITARRIRLLVPSTGRPQSGLTVTYKLVLRS